MPDINSSPSWQCVAVCWGTKYSADHLNDLFNQVRKYAVTQPSFVLLTDRVRDDLQGDVLQRLIDPYYRKPEFMAGGAQAKLAQFVAGALPYDVPTIFLDLDTLVLGDISHVTKSLMKMSKLVLLGNNPFAFTGAARIIERLTGGFFKTRGNSSMMCYLPSHNHHIDTIFRDAWAGGTPVPSKIMTADDRFISWIDHARIRAIPTSVAVKFPREYMRRWRWLVSLQARLPWVLKRRASLAVISFPGSAADLDVLRKLPEGAILSDGKNRLLIWDDKRAFPVKQALR